MAVSRVRASRAKEPRRSDDSGQIIRCVVKPMHATGHSPRPNRGNAHTASCDHGMPRIDKEEHHGRAKSPKSLAGQTIGVRSFGAL